MSKVKHEFGKINEELTTSQREKVNKLSSVTDMDSDDCEEYLIENDWDLTKAHNDWKKEHGDKKKKPKDKKIFNVGDIVTCIDNKPGKLAADCVDFLITYKKFKVLRVNDKLNIDLGHISSDTHEPFLFSPNRFELLNGTAPVKKAEEEKKVEEKPTAKKSGIKPLSDYIESIEEKEVADYDSFRTKYGKIGPADLEDESEARLREDQMKGWK